mgnify:CR=1 FL=1
MWHWQSDYLKCDLLDPWLHGFFGRSHAGQMPEQLASYLGSQLAYRVKQVHGDRCLISDDCANHPEADGIYTSSTSTSCSIWVCSADCVPILVGDRSLGLVGAIHAGWRGTAAGIVPKMLAELTRAGSKLSDLAIALGPAISGANYQVEKTVADQVTETLTHLVGIAPDLDSNHMRLDLRLVQQQQLIEVGIRPDQIAIAPYCTFQDQELFFSYRRDYRHDSHYHVQWSGIANLICS